MATAVISRRRSPGLSLEVQAQGVGIEYATTRPRSLVEFQRQGQTGVPKQRRTFRGLMTRRCRDTQSVGASGSNRRGRRYHCCRREPEGDTKGFSQRRGHSPMSASVGRRRPRLGGARRRRTGSGRFDGVGISICRLELRPSALYRTTGPPPPRRRDRISRAGFEQRDHPSGRYDNDGRRICMRGSGQITPYPEPLFTATRGGRTARLAD